MADVILHHYDLSPFAQKIRTVLGLKSIPWKSVQIPVIMPKPDLVALTGGFRRTPVMQIGADIYCDTNRIAAELEKRFPEPTLYPSGGEGLAHALTRWADDSLFRPCVNYVFSNIADRLPEGLLADRAQMRNAPPPDVKAFMAMSDRLLAQLRPQIAMVESMLGDGRPFLTGDRPGLADFAVYHPLWMLAGSGRKAAAALEPFDKIGAWLARLNEIGIGPHEEMDSKEALRIAKDSEPAALGESEPDAASPKLGDKVGVIGIDKVPEPVVGEVVRVSANAIAVRREGPEVGVVHVHFPRIGYLAQPV